MNSRTILSTIVCIAVLALTTTVQAASRAIPPLPNFPSNEWTPGSSLTYSCTFNQGSDDMSFDLRVAVLGTQHEEATNTDLFWIELDFTEITGLGEEAQQFFTSTNGEIPSAVRMNLLIPKYDLNVILTDPSKAYMDFSSTGFIRKLYFQYNRQTPEDVDPALISGFFLPLTMSEVLGSDLPEDFMQTRDIGVDLVQDPQKFTRENSESRTTTAAGDFTGNLFTYTSTSGGSSGSMFYSVKPPIFPFVTYNGLWPRDAGDISLEMELKAIEESGATTGIVGTPQLLDLQRLMYGP